MARTKRQIDAANLKRARVRAQARLEIVQGLLHGLSMLLPDDEVVKIRGDAAYEEITQIDLYLKGVLGIK